MTRISEVSVRELLIVLFKRKKILFYGLLASVFLFLSYMALAKTTYEARASVLVRIGRENFYAPVLPTLEKPNITLNADREQQINSAILILQNKQLAAKTLDEVGRDKVFPRHQSPVLHMFCKVLPAAKVCDPAKTVPDPRQEVARFGKSLYVKATPKSDVVTVAFSHADPAIAAKVVATLIDEFIVQHAAAYTNSGSFAVLASQSDKMKRQLYDASVAFGQFKAANKITTLDEQRRLLLERQSRLQEALVGTFSREAWLEGRTSELRSSVGGLAPVTAVSKAVEQNVPLLQSLQARLAEMQASEAELLVEYADQSPKVKTVRGQIGIIKAQLAAAENKLYAKQTYGADPVYQTLITELHDAEAEIKGARMKWLVEQQEIDTISNELQRLNDAVFEYNNLQLAVDVARKAYENCQIKLEEARMLDAVDSRKTTNISVIDAAQADPTPNTLPLPFVGILCLAVGLGGGVAATFLIENLSDRVEQPTDVDGPLQLPVLASMPFISKHGTSWWTRRRKGRRRGSEGSRAWSGAE